jgi:hypothetical protein
MIFHPHHLSLHKSACFIFFSSLFGSAMLYWLLGHLEIIGYFLNDRKYIWNHFLHRFIIIFIILLSLLLLIIISLLDGFILLQLLNLEMRLQLPVFTKVMFMDNLLKVLYTFYRISMYYQFLIFLMECLKLKKAKSTYMVSNVHTLLFLII